MTNGTSEHSDPGETENKNEIPEDLPEGAVIGKPEAIEESIFKGPGFPSSKKKVSEATGYLATVHCSACGEQINTNKKGDAQRHPELSVLICRRCLVFHTSKPIEQDKDGVDEQCRWCSEGGSLFGCDYCHNAFCKSCIEKNLGREEFSRVKYGEKFKCYVCNPEPLAAMVEQCNSVIDTIAKEFKKLDEMAQKKKEIVEKQIPSGKTSGSKDKTPKVVDTNKLLVIKLPGIENKFQNTSTPRSKENDIKGTKPSVISQGTKDSPLSSLIKQTASSPLKTPSRPFLSMLKHNATSHMADKQNVIYVDTSKASAKQLVYVQPKPHQVPMVSLMPAIQQTPDQLAQLSSIRGTIRVRSSMNHTQQTPSVTAQIQTCQTPALKLTTGNSSLKSTPEKDLLISDSENDDSKIEVLNITDSAKNKNSVVNDKSVEQDKLIDLEKEETDMETDIKISEKNKKVAVVSEDKNEKQSEQKLDKDNKLKINESEKSAKTNADYDSESTDAENDAAHLELLHELQEMSGTWETTVKAKDDRKAEEKKSDTKNVLTTVEADIKKDQKKDESREKPSNEESNYVSSDNSKKDSDFDINTERTTRTLEKEKKKGTDLDDLSSTEEYNVKEEENEEILPSLVVRRRRLR